MRALSAAQLDILSGVHPGRVALLFDLAHPEGPVRMSSLSFDWVDANSVSWTGSAAVLSFGADFTRGGLQGGATTITWNGASPEMLALARDGKVMGARLTRYLAFIDDAAMQVGDLFTTFSGVCEQPDIDSDPRNPTITLTVESRVLLLNRANAFRYTPESQARYFPGDTGFDFVADLQNAVI